MKCPICGANCRCRNRGPGGICCSCHRHKVRKLLKADFVIGSPYTREQWTEALNKHKVDMERTWAVLLPEHRCRSENQ